MPLRRRKETPGAMVQSFAACQNLRQLRQTQSSSPNLHRIAELVSCKRPIDLLAALTEDLFKTRGAALENANEPRIELARTAFRHREHGGRVR